MVRAMFVSRDGHWKVTAVTMDDQPLLRVLHDTMTGTPVHQVDANRAGSIRMAGGWFWAGDVRSPADVERFVPLAELTEIQEVKTRGHQRTREPHDARPAYGSAMSAERATP